MKLHIKKEMLKVVPGTATTSCKGNVRVCSLMGFPSNHQKLKTFAGEQEATELLVHLVGFMLVWVQKIRAHTSFERRRTGWKQRGACSASSTVIWTSGGRLPKKSAGAVWLLYSLGPPARCPFTVSFLGEGSPKIDHRKKGTVIVTSLLDDLIAIFILGELQFHSFQKSESFQETIKTQGKQPVSLYLESP